MMMTKKVVLDQVTEAAAAMERAALIAEAAERELLHYETALDPTRRVGGNGTGFSEDEVLDAIERRPEARISAARAARAAKDARARYEAAMQVQRGQRGESIRAQMKPVAEELCAALLRVVELNETAMRLDAELNDTRNLDERQADAFCGGAAFARVGLKEITRERIDFWRAALVTEGVLVK
jgi:hypothetical protein